MNRSSEPNQKKPPSSGISTTWHFFARDVFESMGKAPPQPASQTPKPAAAAALPENGDVVDKAKKIVLENPGISGATLLNTLDSKGMTIAQKPLISVPVAGKNEKEADSGSAHAATLRAAPKKESSAVQIRCRLVEGAASDNGVGHTRFRATLIQEGLGNLRDAFYYTRECLEGAVTLFEGKKIYADHPSATEEETRPERSVKDILGHFENVRLEEGADGQAMLTADVVTLSDEPYRWARALMRHAVQYAKTYPDKDFVGLSINATGEAEPMGVQEFVKEHKLPESAIPKLNKAIEQGVDTVKVVSALSDAISCDLVTEAGAGGKILQMLEMEKNQMSKKAVSKESDKKEEQKKEQAAPGAEQPKHDDAAQDMELIKKMLKDYLGDESSENEECVKAAKEAYEAHKEMGKGAEEAMKCAGEAMKLAKHMAGKKAKEAGEEKKDEPKADAEKKDGEQKESEENKKESADAKESGCSHCIQHKGEIARLKEENRKFTLRDYLDKKLKESKKPMKVTEKFREALGQPKSEGEIDKAWNLFVTGYEGREAGEAEVSDDIFVMVEKNTKAVEENEGGSALDLSDCLNQ